MLIKLTASVNFIKVLCAAFTLAKKTQKDIHSSCQSFCTSFLPNFAFVQKFLNNHYLQKKLHITVLCKRFSYLMLMKLTIVLAELPDSIPL